MIKTCNDGEGEVIKEHYFLREKSVSQVAEPTAGAMAEQPPSRTELPHWSACVGRSSWCWGGAREVT